jgi:hypothetical protein
MTKKELIEALAEYPDDAWIVNEVDGDLYSTTKTEAVPIHVLGPFDLERHRRQDCLICKAGYDEIKTALLLD